MKILKSEIDWDKTINIQMTLKEFKLLQDCLFSVSYSELEKTQEKIPYSYGDMQETIEQSETTSEQLFCK